MQNNQIQEAYYSIPIVTRVHASLVVLITLLSTLELVSPFHLYYNYSLVFNKYQFHRLFSTFLYSGNLSIDFLFHLFFLVRYSRMLEENSFRNRTFDFLYLFILACPALIVSVSLLGSWVNIPFLSSPLTFLLVYIWSRRNPHLRMNMLGLFSFSAPYLPWVLLGFSVLMNNHFPAVCYF